jgi:hypothetical protein
VDAADNDRAWLQLICAPSEVDRAANVSCAADHLLRLRADAILNHARLTRVFIARRRLSGAAWSLTGAFDDSHYTKFLAHLAKEDREGCSSVHFGDVFSTDPNGAALSTPYGPLVTVCYSLTFFCKFAHLALLDFGEVEVPLEVRLAALLIAIRVMFKFEALDFGLDPRGTIPRPVAETIVRPIATQLEWIAGHEFMHVLLGHVSGRATAPIRTMVGDAAPTAVTMAYERSLAEELEADRCALIRPRYTAERRLEVRNCALLWLSAVELYEVALNTIAPAVPWRPRTHPTARERADALLAELPLTSPIEVDAHKHMRDGIEFYSDALKNYLQLHIDQFETYGSVYLAEPNTEWRGPSLVDREDY